MFKYSCLNPGMGPTIRSLALERSVLADGRDERVEVARIGHRAAHGLRLGDRAVAVGEGDRAGLGQKPDLGDLAALETLRQRRRREDADLGVVARAPQDEVDHRRAVDLRIGVGPDHEARDPARRRRRAGAGDRLAILGARLADEGAHVDESGRDHVAGAIDDARPLGDLVARHVASNASDHAVARQQPAARFCFALGIYEAGVEKGDRRG